MAEPPAPPAEASALNLSVRHAVANAILELRANPYGFGSGIQPVPAAPPQHGVDDQFMPVPRPWLDELAGSESSYDCAYLIRVINEGTPEPSEGEESLKPEDAIEIDRAELTPGPEQDRPEIDFDVSPGAKPEVLEHNWEILEQMETSPPEHSASTTEPERPGPEQSLSLLSTNECVQPTQQTDATGTTATPPVTPVTPEIPESRRAQTCKICGKILAHASSLYRHHRLKHNKNRTQKLEEKKTEDGPGYLKKGLAMMTKDKNGNPIAKCNMCGKGMPSLADLRRHKFDKHKLETPAHMYAAEGRSLVEH